ncbi:MAG: HEPN domain-containing protein [Armatimonadota bacterium]|nr:HEPN domain-containing protein [Armatimonadota bacterium]MDR7444693.1 HEPN domain-containing protein [Armatimonadota bacterium]MDR7569185.1 HEPN domain-containing protein [Armatimonadota bacterium]MDR7613303.1 HEPN domain-containing protein [Armatimonadota bacterium]
MNAAKWTEEALRWLKFAMEDLRQAETLFRHNLNALRDLLPAGWRVKDQYPDLSELTVWAIEARYPGDWPEATREDANRAVLEARGVLDSIIVDFRSRGVEI